VSTDFTTIFRTDFSSIIAALGVTIRCSNFLSDWFSDFLSNFMPLWPTIDIAVKFPHGCAFYHAILYSLKPPFQ
jgi:hypothetical protein